jgi:uncharacterized membrane protein YbaN (DUF454 family)
MSQPYLPEPSLASTSSFTTRSRWLRPLWLLAGWLALLLGFIGIFLPLLPTTPFVLLASFCFSRGSQRWEHWLLHHRVLGPVVQDWRASRAVPLRAKQLATLMMALSCAWAWWAIASWWRLAPLISCTLVVLWLWHLPTRARRA